MPRTMPPLVLDDDSQITLALRVPAPLYRTLHHYCVFRGTDVGKIPVAATAAIRAYFAADTAFQAWLREQPDLPVTLPTQPVRHGRQRRRVRADDRAPTP